MFGLFKRGFRGGGPKPSLDAVRFDTTGYVFTGELQPGALRVWHTPEGDGLGLYFYPLPPDLPAGATSVVELAAFYRRLLAASDTNSGGKLVEIRVVVAGGRPAVRTIVSVAQQPSGRSYIGSLTLPFRAFSFVFKCQCAEGEPTGLKEALLIDRSWAAKEPAESDGAQLSVPEWDPDSSTHDAEFPGHPVARVRRVLDHVEQSLVVAGDIRQLPGFALPR
jgi:hypothetical protein